MNFEYGYSCEFLSPTQLLKKNVPKLMADHQFGLFLKVFDNGLNEEYKHFLKVLDDHGVYDQLIPWPLLPVRDGYYANTFSAKKFSTQVKRLLEWTATNAPRLPKYVLVDLEPPTDIAEATKAEAIRKIQLDQGDAAAQKLKQQQVAGAPSKSGFDIMKFVGKLIDMIDENVDEPKFTEATRVFDEMVDMVHGYGPKTIAVSLPYTFHDAKDNDTIIQQFMTCPVLTPKWDLVNYMTFATDFVNGTKGIISHEDFLNLVFLWGKEFIKYHRPKNQEPSMCFGITSYGIADVKAIQTDAELYRQEFSAALSAGIKQLGIYALEGVLALPDPEHFLTVVRSAKPDFTPDPERQELAKMVFRLMEGIDYIAPVLKYLVKSGKVMQIIQALGSNLLGSK